MLIAAKSLAMVPIGPTKYIRLAYRLRYFSTSGDGNIVKVSCSIAVEMIQQMLVGLGLHGFFTVHGMSQLGILSRHQLPSPWCW